MALTKIGTDGVKDDAVTSDKVANAINSAIATNTAKTQTTINNNADNRVITGSGTANTLNGESTLTWNGTLLDINQSGTVDTGLKLRNSEGGLYVRTNDDKTFIDTDQLIIRNEAETERMRIDSSGNMLLGRTSISFGKRLNIQGSSGTQMSISSADTTSGSSGTGAGIEFRYHTGSAETSCDALNVIKENGTSGNTACALTFKTKANGGSPTERMRINSDGDLQIGQIANDTRLGIKTRSTATSLDFITCRNTNDALKFYVHQSGNVYNTNGNYSQISDQSLKENIVDANSQWDDIKNIKIRNFNFTEARGMDTHTQIGCVAQEVETVSPKLVTTPREDGIKTVSNSVLYMKAVKALQEAMAKIETLETKVAALEAD